MRLEEEIKQKKFKSEHHKLMVNLIYTTNWLMSIHGPLMKQYGLTVQQYNILRILRGQYPNPCTVNLLKERMLDKMSDASRLVDRLLEKSLLERRTCENDRRRVDISITAAGLDLLKKVDEDENKLYARMNMLSEEEASLVNDLLDKLRGNMKCEM
ncbi:MAG: MarR family transcriptional regulator [Ignavibacteriaceae bacterium]|nr:MAG: MarR family transcriptional regulator [Ignavibacteriaceae bacterium]